MNAASIEALREMALRPKVEEGTTVRFKVTYDQDAYIRREMPQTSPGRVYSFVAVLLGGFWYSTAQVANVLDDDSKVLAKMSQAGFAAVLRSPQVSDVQVATSWESL